MIAEPVPAPARTVTPHGSRLLVRFLKPPEKLASGLWLPQQMQSNTSEARVVAVGKGRPMPVPAYYRPGELEHLFRYVVWPDVGDVVLLEDHRAQMVGDGEAYVDSEDCLGVVTGDDIAPLSDWVLLEPEARPDVSEGGVHLADRVQRFRQKGTVQSYGPGRLEVEGGCAIQRRTVKEALQWPAGYKMIGADVYWERSATIMQVGREQVEAWMVRASEILGYDEETLVETGE